MAIQREEVERLEKISGQMDGLHKEVSALARKSPNDGLNKFKLKFVNVAIAEANSVLGEAYRPFDEFIEFNIDDLPTNSDVTFILGQYIEELERKRADNIKRDAASWIYNLSDSYEKIRTAPPKKINERK
ncbi:MAG: hypothetical protein ACR65U_10020 [Methylocystis sp.]